MVLLWVVRLVDGTEGGFPLRHAKIDAQKNYSRISCYGS